MKEHRYYLYIMASDTTTLYTCVTNSIERRVYEHKNGTGSEFTSKYKVDNLVYYEVYSQIEEAIVREKQIKGWVRSKKLTLILELNPTLRDLSEDFMEKE